MNKPYPKSSLWLGRRLAPALNFSHWLGGDSGGESVGRNIPRDNRPCRDDAVVANRDSFKNHDSCPHPHVVANHHFVLFGAGFHVFGQFVNLVHVVVNNRAVPRNSALIPDGDRVLDADHAVEPDAASAAHAEGGVFIHPHHPQNAASVKLAEPAQFQRAIVDPKTGFGLNNREVELCPLGADNQSAKKADHDIQLPPKRHLFEVDLALHRLG